MEATIRFKDGTEIEAEVNGNCFITNEQPVMPVDITGLVIETEEGTTLYEDPELIICANTDNRFWFSFTEKSKEKKQAERIAALEDENKLLIECILEISEEVWK